MENYNSNYNDDYEFYDSKTFDIDIYKDDCTPITDNVVSKNFVNDALTCIGKWCIDNTFNCIHRDTQNCYDVEHIIDTTATTTISPPPYNHHTTKTIANTATTDTTTDTTTTTTTTISSPPPYNHRHTTIY